MTTDLEKLESLKMKPTCFCGEDRCHENNYSSGFNDAIDKVKDHLTAQRATAGDKGEALGALDYLHSQDDSENSCRAYETIRAALSAPSVPLEVVEKMAACLKRIDRARCTRRLGVPHDILDAMDSAAEALALADPYVKGGG